MIKLFEEWLNEGIQNDAVDKVIAQFEAWAKSLNLDYGVNKYGDNVVCHVRLMGYWTLEYEKSKTKGKQDSMYRQTYNTGDTHKWYIKYPARFSQYSPRSNVKSGNLKTFKSLIERFMKTKEKFDMIHEFLKLVDAEKFKEAYTVIYSGKNLKDLSAKYSIREQDPCYSISRDGDVHDASGFRLDDFSKWDARFGERGEGGGLKYERQSFDPSTGALFYYALKATNTVTDEPDSELLSILEILKDKPVEKVWDELKGGDWKALKKKYAGATTGKQYGV